MLLKWIVLFVPLILFIVLVVFLLKGLGNDPTHLESVLINKPVPEFSAEDLFDPAAEAGRYDHWAHAVVPPPAPWQTPS